MSRAYIAIDLGAESGRVIVGVLAATRHPKDDVGAGCSRLLLEEVHRFTHEPVWLPTGLHWDVSGIWREIVHGLRKAANWATQNKVELVSVGVDTWGVDWALVDQGGELVGLPHAYRDPRNAAAYEEVVRRLGAERIYQTTGIQLMALNSLYSLYAHRLADSGALVAAERLVFMPDLLHYWLSGNLIVEATIASTSQMVDCRTGDWAWEMLAELDVPAEILGPIVPPGSVVGVLRAELAKDTSLPADLQVIAPATHDTASAVAAVPGGVGGGAASWCYLSSGTWSLLGAELTEPCTNAAAQGAMFTNELGVCGSTRFLKNIAGLWLVQEVRRDLIRLGQQYDYPELMRLADEAEPFCTLVDPAHGSFQTPGEMLRKIADFARATIQPIPDSPGQYVRCCLESLALAYREKLATLESILNRKFDVLHVVGGGGKNALLCQMTSDAIGRPVVVGPYEATAMGNALVQALACGHISSLAELREIVARSSDLVTYQPCSNHGWPAAYGRFLAIIE